MIAEVYVALHLLTVHGPGNQIIELNIDAISSVREPRRSEGHFHRDVRCLLIMTNGRIVTVVETCNQINDLLSNAEGQEK